MLSRFRHQHIIRILGFARGDGVHCILLELAERGSLQAALEADAAAPADACRLTWPLRLRCAVGLAAARARARPQRCGGPRTKGGVTLRAQALTFLHQHPEGEAWHRDIKSGNVVRTQRAPQPRSSVPPGNHTLRRSQVLTHSWEPKLIDCGLSKMLQPDAGGRRGTTGVPFGTPEYMCPLYASKVMPYSAAAESFSFGVVLLELLTGRIATTHAQLKTHFGEEEDPEDEVRHTQAPRRSRARCRRARRACQRTPCGAFRRSWPGRSCSPAARRTRWRWPACGRHARQRCCGGCARSR